MPNFLAKGLNGKEYQIKMMKKSRKGSSLHELAREVISFTLPSQTYYEEVTLPGTGTPSLRADFLIPDLRIIVEVHGEQHYKYIKHFHGNKMGFINSLKRDKLKKDWCELNNIRMVEFPYNDTISWTNRILEIIGTNRTS